jgi:lipopolysaccharide export system protein LptC
LAEEIIAFILVVVVIAIFAWLIKLSYDLKKALRTGFDDVDYKVSNLENAAVNLKKDLDKMEKGMEDKIDKNYLEERLDALLHAVRRRK